LKYEYLDENKVRNLLEHVAQNQEQYNTYKQKKRQEFKNHLNNTSMITTNASAEYQNTLGKESSFSVST
jgi:hypothetical protein